MLVYDENDIWLFDLTGNRKAKNITHGFGKSQNIIFSLFDGGRSFSPVSNLGDQNRLILRSFNTLYKTSGFYVCDLTKSRNPTRLSEEENFTNFIPGCYDANLSNIGKQPIKGGSTNNWIVQRQTSFDAPNYFATTNFKTFKRLTNIQPQAKFTWLTEELHSFKYLSGITCQGILFKPTNFDSTKKYPLVVIIYGNYSNNFQQFPNPSYNINSITSGTSPAWLISNGYLVFALDIYVSPLKFGPEAENVIENAVNYLKKIPYIDCGNLACCTHSWSSKLGGYIFTHSKSFKAMAMSEGYLYGNLISMALSTNERGENELSNVENGFRYGEFWENKQSWLNQTTIFNVDKSSSALLMLGNRLTSPGYENQSFQLFNALRRLEKPVWWLKYYDGKHNLENIDDQKDYTIRYTQFLDHFLKQAPAPTWMTKSIMHAIGDAEIIYSLDPTGYCQENCPICKKWNQQAKRHPEMLDMPISEWHLDSDLAN